MVQLVADDLDLFDRVARPPDENRSRHSLNRSVSRRVVNERFPPTFSRMRFHAAFAKEALPDNIEWTVDGSRMPGQLWPPEEIAHIASTSASRQLKLWSFAESLHAHSRGDTVLQFLRSLGPAVASTAPMEAVRAGIGAFVGLGFTGFFLLSHSVDLEHGLYLVAPLGATAVLLFAVPNSPLAQPWSAVVGNTVAALVGVAISLYVHEPTLRIALAVGLAIAVTFMLRAVHPPAGAVAMTAAMSPDAVTHLGFWFALAPIATGTASLVLIATIYARLTGRRYPFRQFDHQNRHGTADRSPVERLGLSEVELSDILQRYRQSFNLGVEDLARLIGAAELQAAAHHAGTPTAAAIMSTKLITVKPSTDLGEVADLFKRHRFTSLPVVDEKRRFLGIIFQMHLISRAREDALRLHRGLMPALRRLIDPERDKPVRAIDIMSVTVPRAIATTPLGALLPLMGDTDVDAVPVLEYGKLIGIVTRTDLIAAMARGLARTEV